MSSGLEEIPIDGQTRKSSKYRKEFFSLSSRYPIIWSRANEPGQILIEVNTFANPYPFEIKSVSSFIYDFLLRQNAEDVIEEYELQPFLLPVLDKRRTLTEKMVSLQRYSLAQDYIKEMSAKIRHFYDIHFLINDAEVYQYFTSDDFLRDFTSLFTEDQERFEQPDGWHHRGGNSIYGLLVSHGQTMSHRSKAKVTISGSDGTAKVSCTAIRSVRATLLSRPRS